jgi:hypothetical protein
LTGNGKQDKMKKLNSLPTWNTLVNAWRGDTGYRNTGLTAFDVVQYEIKELGNYADFKHLSKTMLKELKGYSADDIIWVTKSKRQAKHYGEVCLVYMTGDERIIATDKDNGFLILK